MSNGSSYLLSCELLFCDLFSDALIYINIADQVFLNYPTFLWVMNGTQQFQKDKKPVFVSCSMGTLWCSLKWRMLMVI